MDVIGGSLMKKKSEWANLTFEEVIGKLAHYCVILTPEDFSIPTTVHNVSMMHLKCGTTGSQVSQGTIRMGDINYCSRAIFEESPHAYVMLKDRNPGMKYKEVRRSEYIRY
jgi:hypothetical protein